MCYSPNAIDGPSAFYPYAATWLPFGPPEFLVEPSPPAEPEAMPPGIPEAVPTPSPPRLGWLNVSMTTRSRPGASLKKSSQNSKSRQVVSRPGSCHTPAGPAFAAG